jgi:hypothetical protein
MRDFTARSDGDLQRCLEDLVAAHLRRRPARL